MKSETEKFLVLQAVCWWTCGRPTDRQNDGQECGTAVSRDLLEYTAVVVDSSRRLHRRHCRYVVIVDSFCSDL